MSNGLFQWLKNYFAPAKGEGLNLDRRKVLTTGIAVASGAMLLQVQPAAAKKASNASYLRPPGAGEEEEFLSKCIRCGECMKACPTNAIQPAMFENGLKGMWTPLMNMRVGYCDIHCTTCMQVCPTGALQPQTLAVKKAQKLGVAVIDRTRCLPTAEGKECSMCQKQCPLTDKAISLESVQVTIGSATMAVSQPKVNHRLCIGCGICENKCPVPGEAAIRVMSV